VTSLIASLKPNLLLYLGDVYEDGSATEFYNWYGNNNSFYSRFRSITNPTIGNHEYLTTGAAGSSIIGITPPLITATTWRVGTSSH